jgi:hypothetical protein
MVSLRRLRRQFLARPVRWEVPCRSVCSVSQVD